MLAGQRPISLAVDVTNYVMFELGRPIHGYDADKLTGPIRVRRAQEGERLTTLDGNDRTLSPEDLVVTDDSGIIGLGGVMGGETTEMSETTTRVLIEAAHWDAVSMFRTGRRHKLTSEAGKRNERGVDPTICEAAADRVAELLAEYGGGTIEPGVTVVGDAAGAAHRHDPDRPARARHRHGHRLDTTIANLEAVGCEVEAGADELTATVPPWRPDLSDPFDLVEEVARIVGYEDVPSVLPHGAVRSRPHAGAVDAPPGRPHAGRRGVRRGAQLPLHRGGRPRPARHRRRRPPSYDAPAGQPAQQRRTVDDHHAAARPAPHGGAQRRAAAPATSPSSRPHRSRSRTPASARRSCRSTAARPRGSGTTSTRRCPTSRCTSPSPSAATATAPAGGARAARRAGATSSRPRASSPTRSVSS